ncbi:MAG: aromatic amino acid ammonia-lyase [Patescibacteria group bacterium]
MVKRTFVLTGKDLKIAEIYSLVNDPSINVEVSPEALENIKKSNLFIEKRKKDGVVYGLNTGFGPMASYLVSDTEIINLQYNLVRSHAVGMGEPISETYSLAAMLVRLNTLIKGYSGVSIDLINKLLCFINKRIVPVIYEHGAVGTSGDLVQLAHIALALIGEGEVFYEGVRQSTSVVISKLGIEPHQLRIKEGLALINGTSVMSAIAAILCVNATSVLNTETKLGALSLELVRAFKDSLDEKLHQLRPHPGQVYVAERLRTILDSSKLMRDREMFTPERDQTNSVNKISEMVQEVYSIRCLAQILGPVYESIEKAREIIEVEINSATDNPIVDWEQERFLHGGNFHGDYVAYAVDQLKMTMVKLSILSERRINFFLNTNVNKSFPPFLNLKQPGLTLALQGLQFVATSTTAQNQTLAFPQYVHSISTNGDNQDVVSMGTDAALLCAKVIENNYIVQAIELVTLSQCVDFLRCSDQLSNSTKEMFAGIRKIFPEVMDDRVIIDDLKNAVGFLKSKSH